MKPKFSKTDCHLCGDDWLLCVAENKNIRRREQIPRKTQQKKTKKKRRSRRKRNKMPKNKGKGGKNHKRGKNEADDEKRELLLKQEGQEYAQVIRMLGNGRLEAKCQDGVACLCHISGKLHKKVWIAAGDILLVGLRDFQDGKADVIYKYMPDEARLLKANGKLNDSFRPNESGDHDDDNSGDGYIEFEDADVDTI
ncbi:eukaryotic translation initiation factor 1A-like [Rosa rugosa]|uniref:eukaryotic translation initiation factor 1A-like n=1 Tax=Rosa rugosa TaxID=74645 RepID=UPI002B417AF4|nr:eukaryotic translation initiation factor 1A-like [Rosa rugosa]